MKRNEQIKTLSRQFLDTVEQFNKFDGKAHSFGTDHILYHAEIHLIEFIGSQRECGVSEIAKEMEVTKGAVSQMVKKLAKKGYLTKEIDPQNRTRVLISLTGKGETAYNEHKKFHELLDAQVLDATRGCEKSEIGSLLQFLKSLEEQWR